LKDERGKSTENPLEEQKARGKKQAYSGAVEVKIWICTCHNVFFLHGNNQNERGLFH